MATSMKFGRKADKHLHVYVNDGKPFTTRVQVNGDWMVNIWQDRACACGHHVPKLLQTREE